MMMDTGVALLNGPKNIEGSPVKDVTMHDMITDMSHKN